MSLLLHTRDEVQPAYYGERFRISCALCGTTVQGRRSGEQVEFFCQSCGHVEYAQYLSISGRFAYSPDVTRADL